MDTDSSDEDDSGHLEQSCTTKDHGVVLNHPRSGILNKLLYTDTKESIKQATWVGEGNEAGESDRKKVMWTEETRDGGTEVKTKRTGWSTWKCMIQDVFSRIWLILYDADSLQQADDLQDAKDFKNPKNARVTVPSRRRSSCGPTINKTLLSICALCERPLQFPIRFRFKIFFNLLSHPSLLLPSHSFLVGKIDTRRTFKLQQGIGPKLKRARGPHRLAGHW